MQTLHRVLPQSLISNWPVYQKFLTHLTDFLSAHESNLLFCSGPKWLIYQECSFISGLFVWSAL